MSDGKLVELDADQYELDLGDFTTEQSGNYVITVKYESKGVKFEERFNIQVIEKRQQKAAISWTATSW